MIGTTFSGRPSIFIIFAELSSLIKGQEGHVVEWQSGKGIHGQLVLNTPLVIQSSVASLFLIITGIPIHSDNFPGK